MKRTPLTAMLTLVAVLASTVAVAGCGGKSASSSTRQAGDEQHADDHDDDEQAQVQTGLLRPPVDPSPIARPPGQRAIALIPTVRRSGARPRS